MSPEQARGAIDEIGPHSDQFSLGVVLYRLLAGKTPFQGSAIVVLQQVIHQTPPKLADLQSNIDPDLEAICEKARAKLAEDRYVDCQAFADDLKRFLNGWSVLARPPSIVTRAIRWTNNHRRETALAILCLIIGTASLIASATDWASAYRAAASAELSEQKVRLETERLEDLEKQLQWKVNVAEEAKNLAIAAKAAEAKERISLDSENEQLKIAREAAKETVLDAEARLAALNEAKQTFSDLQSEVNAFQEMLGLPF